MLARAIGRLISEPALRARLGENARMTFERRFAPAVFAAELHELYSAFGLPPAGTMRGPFGRG